MNEKLITPVQNTTTNPVLVFRDGQCEFRSVSEGGTTISRLVSWEDVREAATGIPVDSGWLVPEIVRWGTGRHGDWCVAFIPPGRHNLELTVGVPGPEETVVRVIAPLPGMVIFGVSLKYFIWAVKTERLDPYKEVYRAPLPNVMQDASVCWGPLKPATCSPRTILQVWKLFTGSTFNNHAASGKSKMNRDDVREVLKGLAVEADEQRGKDVVYPVDDLVRQRERTGVTLDQCIREFFETGAMPG